MRDYKRVPDTSKPLKPQGPVCVDLCDMHLLIDRKWARTAAGYLRGRDSVASAKARGLSHARMEFLHRVIMAPPEGMLVDHINHDILDNRRCNLRVTTNAGNTINRRAPLGVCGYRGVTHARSEGQFVAQISVGNRLRYLGQFSTKEDAARAYDAAAREFYGALARLNFPESQERAA
jgi:hypothetical protein